jgi:hypothetical protein
MKLMHRCDLNFLINSHLFKYVWAEFVILDFVFKKIIMFIRDFWKGKFIINIVDFIVLFHKFCEVKILYHNNL